MFGLEFPSDASLVMDIAECGVLYSVGGVSRKSSNSVWWI